MWKCAQCAEEVEDDFDICWNCGTSIAGEQHPDFAAETEVLEKPADWVPRIRCEQCGYEGQALLAHFGYRWWMFLLLIVLFPAAIIVWLALMLLANYRYRRCPQCGNHERLREIDVVPAPAAIVAWETAAKLDEENFRINKLIMLVIAFVLFVATSVLMYLVVANS